jgi:hypothetical protein
MRSSPKWFLRFQFSSMMGKMVIHGYPDLMFEQKSWIALNTGSFLFRNCQWSLDLLELGANEAKRARGRLRPWPAFSEDTGQGEAGVLLFSFFLFFIFLRFLYVYGTGMANRVGVTILRRLSGADLVVR